MNRFFSALIIVVAAAVCSFADSVKVYEGKQRLLTGPFQLKGPSPQQRPDEFKPVSYPAVFIENEYFRCCLLPGIGGRLYEVYNKASKSSVFFVNPYLETHADDFEGGHPWNLGGVEVNFPYFHHGNTYNDRWQWARFTQPDGSAGVVMAFTSRPSMQRALFRVMLRPGVARVDLAYRFENLNPYSWGLAAWIDTMHTKTMSSEFILPTPWVAQHGHNAFRTDLQPWPIRNGVDLSWQKNVPDGMSLSEFGWMPRQNFHGCYNHEADRGAARVFDPKTLPAAKLWTQSPPVTPDQYYQHFEIWTATSPVMEDPIHQPALSSYAGDDSWFQVWGIGGYVYANGDLALNLRREPDGTILAGVCGTRNVRGCVVSIMHGRSALYRGTFDLDPAKPWKKQLTAPPGDITIEVIAPDGALLAHYEHMETEQPVEQWQMNKDPRWKGGINSVYYQEDYSVLWRRRGHFFDGSIHGYSELLKKEPDSVKLMIDLARVCLKDAQVRVGYQYGNPGPAADEEVVKRRAENLKRAADILHELLKKESQNAQAHFYLGLALESQNEPAAAAEAFQAALACPVSESAAGMYLARRHMKSKPSKAVAYARTAAEAYPQSTRAKQMLMAALIADGSRKEAVKLGKALYELDPADPITTHLLSQCADKSEAKSFAKETERLLADDAEAKKNFDADLAWLQGT